jgi:hypothetical protein
LKEEDESKVESNGDQDVVGAAIHVQESVGYEGDVSVSNFLTEKVEHLEKEPVDVPVNFEVEHALVFGEAVHDSAERDSFEERALRSVDETAICACVRIQKLTYLIILLWILVADLAL